MGVLFSRFRSKPSTKELLEDIQKDIDAHLQYKHSTELQQRTLIRSLIFYFVLIYLILAGVFLFYSYPITTKDRIIYAIPFIISPLLLYIFKKLLQWYFVQKLRRNDENLYELKKRKKSLLEFAMETETYKVVKELLEKYDAEYHKKVFEARPAITASPTVLRGSFSDMDLRRRNAPSKTPSPPVTMSRPGQTISFTNSAGAPNVFNLYSSRPPTNQSYPPAFYQRAGPRFVRPPMPPPMPRPVLPRERSLADRLVDYLVGDGPSNRYALICRHCQSHNGMALREEFEYVAFRCCYCYQFNPPRNQQPSPPRLTLPSPSAPPAITEAASSEVSTSSDETDFGNISDVDNSPIITAQDTGSINDSKELSNQRLSISSDVSEIQANLVEDTPYDSPPRPKEDLAESKEETPPPNLEEPQTGETLSENGIEQNNEEVS